MNILDFSFRNSISIVSKALALSPRGNNRENRSVTAFTISRDHGFESRPRIQKNFILRGAEVVNSLDPSISKRHYKGISHLRVVSRIFDTILTGIAQLVEHMHLVRGVLGSSPSPGAIWRYTQIGKVANYPIRELESSQLLVLGSLLRRGGSSPSIATKNIGKSYIFLNLLKQQQNYGKKSNKDFH